MNRKSAETVDRITISNHATPWISATLPAGKEADTWVSLRCERCGCEVTETSPTPAPDGAAILRHVEKFKDAHRGCADKRKDT